MKNSGITIITLIITIVVIIILTSIFVASGLESLNEAKITKAENEIKMLKEAVVNRYTSYVKNQNGIALYGTPVKDKMSSSECVERILDTLNNDEKIKKETKITKEIERDYAKFVMLVASGDMARLGLENYDVDNVYIVNYNTSSVYGPIK